MEQRILDLVADTRNKLGLFWTLSQLCVMDDKDLRIKNILIQSAKNCEDVKLVITDNLTRITNEVSPDLDFLKETYHKELGDPRFAKFQVFYYQTYPEKFPMTPIQLYKIWKKIN